MKEKEIWAQVAAELYQTSSKCGSDEQNGFRTGYVFGGEAMRGKIDKRLEYIERNLKKQGEITHAQLVTDIRVAILQFGENQVDANKLP